MTNRFSFHLEQLSGSLNLCSRKFGVWLRCIFIIKLQLLYNVDCPKNAQGRLNILTMKKVLSLPYVRSFALPKDLPSHRVLMNDDDDDDTTGPGQVSLPVSCAVQFRRESWISRTVFLLNSVHCLCVFFSRRGVPVVYRAPFSRCHGSLISPQRV